MTNPDFTLENEMNISGEKQCLSPYLSPLLSPLQTTLYSPLYTTLGNSKNVYKNT